jgi:hypothetical protein
MVTIHPNSHMDHGLTESHVKWLLERFADKTGFFIETVELPDALPSLLSGIHGPAAGDAPVPEDEVHYSRRGDRAGASRLCHRAPRATRLMTVIAGPRGAEPCSLYTAFGGGLAPREPWDASLRTDAEKSESAAFWSVHALSVE